MNAGQSTTLEQRANERLVAEKLCCVRGDKLLFRDLNFALEPGQAALVAGPNGIGKSSLLRLIAGLLNPYSGRIETPASLALCDDRIALDENVPLLKALRFWAQLDGSNDGDIANAMALAGLSHLAEVPIRYFSTGQRQRARLSRTYLSSAKLWLLDEPANGLDKASVDQLGLAMQNHIDAGGIILAASHIPLPINYNITLTLEQPASPELSF